MMFTAEQTKFIKAIWQYSGCVTGRHQGKQEDKDFVLSRLASMNPGIFIDLIERTGENAFAILH